MTGTTQLMLFGLAVILTILILIFFSKQSRIEVKASYLDDKFPFYLRKHNFLIPVLVLILGIIIVFVIFPPNHESENDLSIDKKDLAPMITESINNTPIASNQQDIKQILERIESNSEVFPTESENITSLLREYFNNNPVEVEVRLSPENVDAITNTIRESLENIEVNISSKNSGLTNLLIIVIVVILLFILSKISNLSPGSKTEVIVSIIILIVSIISLIFAVGSYIYDLSRDKEPTLIPSINMPIEIYGGTEYLDGEEYLFTKEGSITGFSSGFSNKLDDVILEDGTSKERFLSDEVCNLRKKLNMDNIQVAIIVGRHDKTDMSDKTKARFHSNYVLAQQRAKEITELLVAEEEECGKPIDRGKVISIIAGPRNLEEGDTEDRSVEIWGFKKSPRD